MNYTISTEPPPCYEAAREKFSCDFYAEPVAPVFTYGDTIHVASGHLQDDVLAHELVHVRQHAAYPGGPAAWWERYLADEMFRYEQEMMAYKEQYRFIDRTVKDRNRKHSKLMFLARCVKDMYAFPGLGIMEIMNEIKK